MSFLSKSQIEALQFAAKQIEQIKPSQLEVIKQAAKKMQPVLSDTTQQTMRNVHGQVQLIPDSYWLTAKSIVKQIEPNIAHIQSLPDAQWRAIFKAANQLVLTVPQISLSMELTQLSSISDFPAIEQIAANILAEAADGEERKASEKQTLTRSLSETVATVFQGKKFAKYHADQISTEISGHFSKLEPQAISLEGRIQILIAIVAIVYAILFNHVSSAEHAKMSSDISHGFERTTELISENKEQLDALISLHQELLEQVEALNMIDENIELYTVKRPKFLYSEPRWDSDKIAKLELEQILEMTFDREDWLYVRYFDYDDCLPRAGWVYKYDVAMLRQDARERYQDWNQESLEKLCNALDLHVETKASKWKGDTLE